MIIKKGQLFNYTSGFIYIVLLIFVCIKGVILFPDSQSFLNLDFHRAIGYKFILQFLNCLFGKSFEFPLLGFQYLLLVFSSYHLCKTIKIIFQLHFIFSIVLLLIVLAPAFYLHFVINKILTESICYPLFLFFTNFMIQGFILKKNSAYFKAIGIVILLVLIRGQFLALIVLISVIISIDIFQKGWSNKRLITLGILVCVPIISNLFEKTYNYINYEKFTATPFNNVSLISPVIFVSDQSDINLLKNDEERAIFLKAYNALLDKRLLYEKINTKQQDIYYEYHHNFSTISNLSIHETGLNYFKEKGLNYNDQLIAVNDTAERLFYPLFKNNFKKWLNLYQLNLSHAFGSKRMILLFAMLLITSFYFILKNKNKKHSKVIFLLVLSIFANHSVVAIAVHSIKRYIFYTDWIIFAVIIILLNEVFTKSELKKNMI